jgi:peptidyl-tRNA hydrolase
MEIKRYRESKTDSELGEFMRRLFIIRKDLELSAGKLAAMVGHCSEAYWTNLIKNGVIGEVYQGTGGNQTFMESNDVYRVCFDINKSIMDDYVNGIFTKTICEARNKTHLLKAKKIAEDLELVEGKDFGEINDKCLTELRPENQDGTTLVGIWFAPLDDDIAHKISKKYQLYRG